jgi:hypothetical protein
LRSIEVLDYFFNEFLAPENGAWQPENNLTEIKREKNHILVAIWKKNMVSHTLLQLG